jgi:hypothetical protein
MRPPDTPFVFIGADAQTEWLTREVGRASDGYVSTGRDVLERPTAGHATWPLTRAADPSQRFAHARAVSQSALYRAGRISYASWSCGFRPIGRRYCGPGIEAVRCVDLESIVPRPMGARALSAGSQRVILCIEIEVRAVDGDVRCERVGGRAREHLQCELGPESDDDGAPHAPSHVRVVLDHGLHEHHRCHVE